MMYILFLSAALVVFPVSQSFSHEIFPEKLVIFGDSYSDNGNTYRVSQQTYPHQAYAQGRFTDGPVWSEYLAIHLGLDPNDPEVFRNYAYGQAQIKDDVSLETHRGNEKWTFTVPDLEGQISEYEDEGLGDIQHALVMIFIGTNDMLNYTPSLDKQANDDFIHGLFDVIQAQIERLRSLGAKSIILFNIRDLTKSPLAKTLSEAFGEKEGQTADQYFALLKEMTYTMNELIIKKYREDSTVRRFDIHAFDMSITEGAEYTWYRSEYKFGPILAECYTNHGNYVEMLGSNCENPYQHYFFDRIHLSTYANKLLADKVAEALIHKD